MRMMNAQKPIRKRSTNVSLNAALVEEAKALGVSVSQSCEKGLFAAVKAEREKRWLEENAEAIESNHAYLAKYGMPLARFRPY